MECHDHRWGAAASIKLPLLAKRLAYCLVCFGLPRRIDARTSARECVMDSDSDRWMLPLDWTKVVLTAVAISLTATAVYFAIGAFASL